jgi:predicted ATPase/DNA-binding CsgD family transcriptional regulator
MGPSDATEPAIASLGISPREAEVLWAVTDRLRNREIAERLVVSVRTVESHVAALLRKLGANDRSALVERGLELRRARRRSRLPAPFTSFVGRSREVVDLVDLLRSERLVTLIGTGGAGKSRLALDVVASADLSRPETVLFADLSRVSGGDVVAALAEAFGVVPEPEQPVRAGLLDAVGDVAALLVVDNCEHVLDAVAPVVRDLLLSASGLRVLATSRAPLGISGEVTFPVDPLALPARSWAPDELVRADAVRLFLDRARAARPGFEPDHGELIAVAEICRRLDGLPLAIELVAPRVRAFSPQQIAEMVHGHLAAVTTADAAAPARHRTLSSTIRWSYDLLDARERVLFARLAVFAGTFDYDAVLEICASGDLSTSEVARSFPRLLDRSMVSAVRIGGPDARYRLLETLRDFARARLADCADRGETGRRYVGHYLALAERAAPKLRGAEHDAWLARLEADGGNLTASITRSISADDAETVARFVRALALFWEDRGPRREAIEWMRWLAERDGAADGQAAHRPADPVVAEALAASGQLLGSWDLDLALSCASGGVEASRGLEPWYRARALEALGWVRAYRDGAAAMPVLEQALALFEEAGDTWHCARVTQAMCLAAEGTATALERGRQSVDLFERTGDGIRMANALYFMARRAIDAGTNLEDAGRWLTRSLALAQARGARHDEAHARLQLARVARAGGDDCTARTLLEHALPAFRSIGDARCVGRSLFEQAALALRARQPDACVALLDECVRASERVADHITLSRARALRAEVQRGP